MILDRDVAVELDDRTVMIELTICVEQWDNYGADADGNRGSMVENITWKWIAVDPIDVDEEMAIDEYLEQNIESFVLDIN